MRSMTVTAANVATVAENNPVYNCEWMCEMTVEGKLGTDKDEDAVSIFLPAFGDLVIFFLCHLAVHIEERS